MKSKQILFLILEGLLVLACVGVVYFLSLTQVNPTDVYRFTRALPANTIITAKDIEKVSIPYSAVTEDFIMKEEDVLGRATKSPVYPGQYAFGAQLKPSDQLTAFDGLDLSDKVKVAIPVEDLTQAVGGLLNSGDVVDLYYTAPYLEVGNVATDGAFYTKRFMEEVVVYKVLDSEVNEVVNMVESVVSAPTPDEEEGEEEDLQTEAVTTGEPAVVVVAVTSEQALEIQTRISTGKVSLVGRFDNTISEPVQDFVLIPGDGVEHRFETVEVEQ